MRHVYPILILALSAISAHADKPARMTVDWNKHLASKPAEPTFQVVVQPPLARGSKIHDEAFKSIANLNANFVRFVPWFPFTRYAVAELEPPTKEKTSWDFKLIDPIVEDFMRAQNGRSVVMNFSTIPEWMFKTPKPVKINEDANKITIDYCQGHELRDPSGKEVGDYFARLLSWYTRGGFTDELGVKHESNYHYNFNCWEILNEPDLEHHLSPEQYTKIYDAMATAMKEVAPQMKFMGASIAFPSQRQAFFEYFLDAKNHKPGVPIDYISYHFYATPESANQPFESQPQTYFRQAENFIKTVGKIQQIRQRLSPQTQTAINEVGTIWHDSKRLDIPPRYWNLSGAIYAYVYCEASKLGIEHVGESQLLGYPEQYPSVSMIDWNTGKPNARWQVLKLLLDHLGPEAAFVKTESPSEDYYVQAFLARDGSKNLLLVNKRNKTITAELPADLSHGRAQIVEESTGGGPRKTCEVTDGNVTLEPFAVAIVSAK